MNIFSKQTGTYGLEGEVALGDHLTDLRDDLALGVGQIDSLVPNIDLTCFAVLPGLISLQQKGQQFNQCSTLITHSFDLT